MFAYRGKEVFCWFGRYHGWIECPIRYVKGSGIIMEMQLLNLLSCSHCSEEQHDHSIDTIYSTSWYHCTYSHCFLLYIFSQITAKSSIAEKIALKSKLEVSMNTELYNSIPISTSSKTNIFDSPPSSSLPCEWLIYNIAIA